MKAKFKVDSVTKFAGAQSEVKLSPVTSGSEENKSFSMYTPSGSLSMHITNPDALGFFEPGKEFVLDFIPAN